MVAQSAEANPGYNRGSTKALYRCREQGDLPGSELVARAPWNGNDDDPGARLGRRSLHRTGGRQPSVSGAEGRRETGHQGSVVRAEADRRRPDDAEGGGAERAP